MMCVAFCKTVLPNIKPKYMTNHLGKNLLILSMTMIALSETFEFPYDKNCSETFWDTSGGGGGCEGDKRELSVHRVLLGSGQYAGITRSSLIG